MRPTRPPYRTILQAIPTALFIILAIQSPTFAAEPPDRPVTVLAVGDITSCRTSLRKKFLTWYRGDHRRSGASLTAALVETLPGTILVMGGLVYPAGSRATFRDCFDPVWGQFKDRIMPVPGEYAQRTGNPGSYIGSYYHYWGDRVGVHGRGYYAFVLGAWHIVALNSGLDRRGRRLQEAWLRNNLARAGARCILAFWHHPLYSSDNHGGSAPMVPVFRILYEAGASIVLNAHNHNYERLAPMAPDGGTDLLRGMRVFVVGTGGQALQAKKQAHPNSEIFDATSWGVLKFELFKDRYAWEFLPVEGAGFKDSGSSPCIKRNDT